MKTYARTFGFAAIFIFLTAVIISQVLAHPGYCFIQSPGYPVKMSRPLTGFNGIRSSGGIDVYLIQGSSEKVEVEADENIQQKIITEVKDQILCMHPESGTHRMKTVKVYVTFTSLKSIEASGGSDVYAENLLTLPELSVEMAGGSDLKMSLKTSKLVCSLTGGSDASFKGSAENSTFSATGGSDIAAKEMVLQNCTVSATGGSDAFLTVTEKLSVTATGGSDVTLYGAPKKLDRSLSGGSEIYIK